MVVSCVVVGCTNRFKKGSGLKFHRIPTADERRRKWLQAINRKNWTPDHDGDRVCGVHFASGSASSDPSDPDYVPHVNMGYKTTAMMTPEGRRDRFKRAQCRESTKNQQAKDNQERSNAASILLELSLRSSANEQSEQCVEEEENQPARDLHGPCIEVIMRLKAEKRQLLKEIENLQAELQETKQQLRSCRFSDKFLDGDKKDAKTLFFTGIPNHATFLWLVQFCAHILPVSMALTPASVLMMVLMKLRLNLVDQDLGYRFGVSRQSVSDLISKTLPPLANQLAMLIHWPEIDDISRNMPKVIQQTYRKCRVIIDCCEIFIERPGNFTARAMTWSNYKSHNTIKVLVGIAPYGAVTFVSRAFGGRVSDKVITQRSGFLQLLEHGDLVLADRGFLISDDLAACGAQLAIPSFTRGKSQLSPKEIEMGRRLSRVRIHVERAIERVKNFKILSTTMKINLVPKFDSIMTVCSALSNLHPSLL
ncbi:uncharacterized protein [Haliotis asinina]|uniref:uncharacterized protein n=1 Tax=Haliotis asinina TaxID=109174 RepID=UPI003531A075